MDFEGSDLYLGVEESVIAQLLKYFAWSCNISAGTLIFMWRKVVCRFLVVYLLYLCPRFYGLYP